MEIKRRRESAHVGVVHLYEGRGYAREEWSATFDSAVLMKSTGELGVVR